MKKYIYWYLHDKIQRLNSYLWTKAQKYIGSYNLYYWFARLTNKSLNIIRKCYNYQRL